MLQDELQAFGRRLGLAELSLGEAGLAALEIEDAGTLSLEMGEGSAEGALIMSLAAPAHDEGAAARFRRALERLDWRLGAADISAGLFRGRLILAKRLPAETLCDADLDQALRELMEKMRELG